MFQQINARTAVVGIDIGKNSFHVVVQEVIGGLSKRQNGANGTSRHRAFT